jgi:cytochrome d ubiquinol oxidase subunit II
MAIDYPLIWAGVIAFAILAYVIMDGFDLGVGILFPFVRGDKNRDQMMNSVAPVWDGNETWLVLGGGGLLATFPLAYGVVLSALYAPVIAMLLALVFRGVAFEFRWRTTRGRILWDVAFTGGSTLAAFSQGIMLGALVQGIPVAGRAYAGGWWDWLTPFSVMTGVALVIGYALLGATWLIMKTEGGLQARAYAVAKFTGLGTFGLIGLVSVWTPLLDPVFMERWFSFPAILYVAPVPILVLLAGWMLYAGIRGRRNHTPFFAALALFVLSYAGLGVSFFPYVIPPAVTIYDAAAPDESLKFLLVGAAVLIPTILAYTGYAYWVFRGKVDAEAGYH